jgi:ADP-ribose pyrophosphatase
MIRRDGGRQDLVCGQSPMPIVFKSRVFSVEVDDRTFPDGRQRQVAIVRHAPVVVLIPIADDGRVILVKQYRAPIDRETWELPAGGINPGETAEAAAARECEEEIGLVPATLQRLGAWYPSPGYCDEEMIFFKVSSLQPPPPDSPHKPDEDENIQTRTLSIGDARAMVTRGDIIDLKSAYGLTLLAAG